MSLSQVLKWRTTQIFWKFFVSLLSMHMDQALGHHQQQHTTHQRTRHIHLTEFELINMRTLQFKMLATSPEPHCHYPSTHAAPHQETNSRQDLRHSRDQEYSAWLVKKLVISIYRSFKQHTACSGLLHDFKHLPNDFMSDIVNAVLAPAPWCTPFEFQHQIPSAIALCAMVQLGLSQYANLPVDSSHPCTC